MAGLCTGFGQGVILYPVFDLGIRLAGLLKEDNYGKHLAIYMYIVFRFVILFNTFYMFCISAWEWRRKNCRTSFVVRLNF